MHCKDCAHYTRIERTDEGEHGGCDSPKLITGYHALFAPTSRRHVTEVKPDEERVEDDEGWGIYVGPLFGCIHFVGRP